MIDQTSPRQVKLRRVDSSRVDNLYAAQISSFYNDDEDDDDGDDEDDDDDDEAKGGIETSVYIHRCTLWTNVSEKKI